MRVAAQTLKTPDGPFTILEDEDGAVIASGWAGLERILAQAKLPSSAQGEPSALASSAALTGRTFR